MGQNEIQQHNPEVIRFDGVVKTYKDRKALDHITFEIPQGSRVTLFGPSGAGKSTILRLIAGLIQPDEGTISGTDVPISMAFQNHQLFEQLSAQDNIAFGLDCRRYDRKTIEEKTRQWAEFFKCADVLKQKAGTLSGGQQQRVGLARAFMKEPKVLLLDETFSAMDYALKEELIEKILQLHKEKNFTLISITHSAEEGQKLGDLMFLMKDGRLIQQGSWGQILSNPQDLFEAGCLGILSVNIVSGETFGFEGFAGLRPSAFIAHPEKDCFQLDARLESKDELGFGWICQYGWNGERIRVLSADGMTGSTLYYPKDSLLKFDLQGQRIHEKKTL